MFVEVGFSFVCVLMIALINYQKLNSGHVQQLRAIVGDDQVSTAVAERKLRAQDMSRHEERLGDVVVWPRDAAQVADVLRLANEERLPLTPWGAGSSLEGNPIPTYGGILLSTERMLDVVKVYADDFQVTVQPGLGYKDLNSKLASYGLFFAPDPGANATIGGMLANNAAGIRTVKYGACKDNVLQMEVALADGRLIRTGSRSIKQASGYDLLHLFIGSEGTLGVITEATLKLAPVPVNISAVTASFDSITAAIEAVVAVRGSGLDVAALEFLDEELSELLTRENGLKLGRSPSLLMELHAAHQATIDHDLALVREICLEMGARTFYATADTAQRRGLWHARHHLFETVLRCYPVYEWMNMDVAVPISAYPELVAFSSQAMADQELFGVLLGHAGDGNLHVTLSFNNGTTYERAQIVNEQVIYKALALHGTATGEHGVGIGKARFMPDEHGPALGVMAAVKAALDPRGILNPGKIFP
jgi:D-lactate dehydrogenase (cytochrome)